MIRGATKQILDESERSLHDALCVLQQTVKETRIVYGGGETSMVLEKMFAVCSSLDSKQRVVVVRRGGYKF